MRFIGDFHIHSHFSIATSKNLVPEYLDYWARVKGIQVVGTGDFTHPGWSKELKEKLEPAEPGLFRLKDGLRKESAPSCGENGDEVRFLLTAEISSIYKKDDRVRKVHNVIFAPDFESVETIQQTLSKIGNITSDGRPILGMDSRDLLEIALEASDRIFFVPAHIWTPWFSALGAKSGFDTIQACYGDLSDHIFAVETGLSSDPSMNWVCSFLDGYTLISNSDAHSPEKLGREANLFDAERSYDGIIQAIKTGDPKHFLGTIEFFPQEGKYHFDGHRKCGICWDPVETLRHDSKCTICGKTVTMGVMTRVAELSDREDPTERENRAPFYSVIPLKEILAEISGVGPNSKKVAQAYHSLVNKAGSEFHVLIHRTAEELKEIGGSLIAEAVRRMRCGDVIRKQGFDGEFGRIRVFRDEEIGSFRTRDTLFGDLDESIQAVCPKSEYIHFDLEAYRELRSIKNARGGDGQAIPEGQQEDDDGLQELNSQQLSAVKHKGGPALVIAGPGTGKTRVLTARTAYLIAEKQIAPENILAITFTNKTADEMRERLTRQLERLAITGKPNVSTFHSFGHGILKEHPELVRRRNPFSIIDEEDKRKILLSHLDVERKKVKTISDRISSVKQSGLSSDQIPDKDFPQTFHAYETFLEQENVVDLDDLISCPVRMFRENADLLSQYQAKYLFILVDEFQDINAVQYHLIRLLMTGDDADLFVVGDPHQAIYGFRGADVRFIRSFLEDYPRAVTYRLKKSYRCSNHILKASGGVIHEETDEYDFLDGLHEGIKIQIVSHPTDKSEAEFAARSIERMMGGLRFFSMDSDIAEGSEQHDIHSLSEIAVLCRIGRQIETIEKAFHDHSIPYQKVEGTPLFKKEPVKSIIDILKIAVNGENGFLKTNFSNNSGIELPDQKELEGLIRIKSVKEIVSRIIDGYFNGSNDENENILNELLNIALDYGSDLDRFLTFAALGTGVDVYRPDVENVALMTLHAAKGLEFECVFIVGCEEGLLPYSLFEKQSMNRDEERRLLYVGMTRAKKYLFLSHAQKRFLFGRDHRLDRSSFLDSIEEDLIQLSRTEHRKKEKKSDQMGFF